MILITKEIVQEVLEKAALQCNNQKEIEAEELEELSNILHNTAWEEYVETYETLRPGACELMQLGFRIGMRASELAREREN